MKTGKNFHRLSSAKNTTPLRSLMIFLTMMFTAGNVAATTCETHNYDKGFCNCGAYEPATQVTAENYSSLGFTAENYTPFIDYYAIANAGQLYWFATLVNDSTNENSANAILINDIKVNDTTNWKKWDYGAKDTLRSWTPIGNDKKKYYGTFNGKGHTIAGLYHSSESDYVGLFGIIDKTDGTVGKIDNVGVIASYFEGDRSVGGVCGYNYGTISNCYSTGTMEADSHVGGVCGDNSGTISNCFSTGTMEALYTVGGVCGNNSGTISNCFSTGTMWADLDVGGVCGDNFGTISNCYYLNDTENEEGGKTKDQFKSGEVAFTLQQWVESNKDSYQTDKNIALSDWGQEIGTDTIPVLGGKKVYFAGGCPNKQVLSNDENERIVIAHNCNSPYDNGFNTCSICNHDVYETPKKINGIYQIANAGQLYWFAALVNDSTNGNSANAILINDIKVNDTTDWKKWDDGAKDTLRSWTPIGKNYKHPYLGTFNGKGHTIIGLYHSSSSDYVGLFGYITGKIDSVGVIASYFKGIQFVGGVCGENYGTISNCHSTGTMSTDKYVGGVCGYNYGVICNCYSTGKIEVSSDAASIGGVCGYNKQGTVSNCFSTGTMEADKYVSGVCGKNYGTISNCYYLSDTENEEGGKTKDQFKSGEVAFFLQQWVETNKDSYQTDKNITLSDWGQEIGTDTIPVLGGKKIYFAGGCPNKPVLSNNENERIVIAHNFNSPYDNGFNTCSICNHEVYETPKKINGIYQIANAGQLYWFAALVNDSTNGNSANAILTADIEVNDIANWKKWDDGAKDTLRAWTPIGSPQKRYTGTFNGKGHTIAGLYHSSSNYCVGLFGYIIGKIDSVGVIASYFKGQYNVGGVCGDNYGTISNCYSTGTVSTSGDWGANVGGVCGYNNGTITNCYSTGSVSASGRNAYVGGVCGRNYKGAISNCYSTGSVSASDSGSNVGGVCGKNEGTIRNSYHLNGSKVCGLGDATDCSQKSKDQFKSGEVAYLLQQWVEANKNSYQTDKNITLSDWGQKIGKDTIPVLGGQKVYVSGGCPIVPKEWSNDAPTEPITHVFNNGFCKHCGAIEPATPVSKAGESTVDHYEIANAGQLYWFAQLVNTYVSDDDNNVTYPNISANAILTADIMVNDTANWKSWNDKSVDTLRTFVPIAFSYSYPYTGTFDGMGHSIRGLYLYTSGTMYDVALFANSNGTIRNLGVEASYIAAYMNVSGICGLNFEDGVIENCYSYCNVNGKNAVGGIAGVNQGRVSNCYSVSFLSSTDNKGGVCGYSDNTIDNSYYLERSEFENKYGDPMTAGDFESGKVAYLLQQWVDNSNNDSLSNWGQKIGTDTVPVFSTDMVYGYFADCEATEISLYGNDPKGHIYQGHDYSDTIASTKPVADGLLAVVCKHNHKHVTDIRIVKKYDGTNDLILNYKEDQGYANNLYVDKLNLIDGKDLNLPIGFFVHELSYDRVGNKDVMTTIFPCDVPAGKVNGLVYQLSEFDGDKTLNYKKADCGNIKANTPYVINGRNRSEANKTKQLIADLTNVTVHATVKDSLVEVIDSTGKATQMGAYAKDVIKCTDEYDFYGYSEGKFKKATQDVTVTPFRSFIKLMKKDAQNAEDAPATNSTKSTRNGDLNIVFEDDDNTETVTGVEIFDGEVIDAVSEFGAKVNVYDVAGRALRLNVPIENALEGLRNGIYIVNGKKVVVTGK